MKLNARAVRSVISGFEKNSLGSREVERLHSEESGGKALSGKGSSLELHPRLEGGSKDLSDPPGFLSPELRPQE